MHITQLLTRCRPVLLAGVAAAALAAAGCGDDDRPATVSAAAADHGAAAGAVQGNLRAFSRAVDAGAHDRACALMTEALQVETGDGDAGRCPRYLGLGGALLGDAFPSYDDVAVDVRGDVATWSTTGGDLDTGRSRRVAGRWLLDVDGTD